MKKLVIRADDLGYCEGVNYGILKSIRDGLVRTVGLMPNMEYARHGYELIRGFDVCLGQHSNVSVGRPCADPSRIPSLLKENGEFRSSSEYRSAFQKGEEFVVTEEAVIELEAQYERFQEITGKKPEYFEAHAVVSDNLIQALNIVAKRHGLRLQEISFDGSLCRFDDMTVRMLPLDVITLPEYEPFEALKAGIVRHREEDAPIVSVYHPGYVDAFLLRNSSLNINRARETEMLCDPSVRRWLEDQNVELVTYRDLP